MTHLTRAGTAVGDKVLFTEYTPFKSSTGNILAEKECWIIFGPGYISVVFNDYTQYFPNMHQ